MLRRIFLYTLVILFGAACSSSNSVGSTSTPTIDLTATTLAIAAEETQAAHDMQTTAEAEAQFATETKVAEKTGTAIALATEDANPMSLIVQQLFEEGYINTTNGTFYQLDDFESSHSDRDTARIRYIDYITSTYVIRADLIWDTEIFSARSGCGFFYEMGETEKLDSSGDKYIARMTKLVWLNVNGRVVISWMDQEGIWDTGIYRLAKLFERPSGSAEIIVVKLREEHMFFLNGEKIFSNSFRFPWDPLEDDKFGYLVRSGGDLVTCKMENIWLWDLDN